MLERSLEDSFVNPAISKSDAPLLSLHGATVIRGENTALKDLTFRIQEGEHTAILGPNGSGKSSFIRLVTRQDYPAHRDDAPEPIQILGQSRWDVFTLRTQMGIVSAELHQAFTAAHGGGLKHGYEIVLSGFFASHGIFFHQHVTPFMHERVNQTLAWADARHLAKKTMGEMSTGEARRILIARALVHDPRALLLDEPTTGLDLAARHHFLQMLQGIAQRGKTILLVTHHIEEILPQIRRVILLKEGRVFRDGSKQEVLTATNLSDLYETPVKLLENEGYFTALCG